MNRLANSISTLVLIVLLIATCGCKSQSGTAFAAAPATRAAAENDAPQEAVPVQGPSQQYSPYVDQTFPNRVLWGLTHIHTSLSADAGLMGVTLGPDQIVPLCQGRGSHHHHRLEIQTGPAAGLARHHRPCRISRYGRSNSRPATPSCSPTQSASSGTTCPRRTQGRGHEGRL